MKLQLLLHGVFPDKDHYRMNSNCMNAEVEEIIYQNQELFTYVPREDQPLVEDKYHLNRQDCVITEQQLAHIMQASLALGYDGLWTLHANHDPYPVHYPYTRARSQPCRI